MEHIELDKKKLSTYHLASRPSKVSIDHFAKKLTGNESVAGLIDKLPGFLAADDLKSVISAIISAHQHEHQILLGMGAHVIKVGLTPLLLQLLEKGVLTGIALN
ncbi:MAG: hypothetical protein J7M09_03085, partial [Deltaproteobacteria bacterium]|nr:hypothetical protein [Candidatus Tharpella sp.]